jgi:hypothetical protein
VIKYCVAMIVFNNKEAEKLVADIKERLHVQNRQEWQGRGSMMC